MHWTIAANKFGFDAVSDTGRIDIEGAWHLPDAYQLMPNPEFEISEIEKLLSLPVTVSLCCGSETDCRAMLSEIGRIAGIPYRSKWEVSGSLSFLQGRLSFDWFLPEDKMRNTRRHLSEVAMSQLPAYLTVRWTGSIIIGDLSIAVQPDLKSRWMSEQFPAALTDIPSIQVVFGERLPPPPTIGDVMSAMKRQL